MGEQNKHTGLPGFLGAWYRDTLLVVRLGVGPGADFIVGRHGEYEVVVDGEGRG